MNVGHVMAEFLLVSKYVQIQIPLILLHKFMPNRRITHSCIQSPKQALIIPNKSIWHNFNSSRLLMSVCSTLTPLHKYCQHNSMSQFAILLIQYLFTKTSVFAHPFQLLFGSLLHLFVSWLLATLNKQAFIAPHKVACRTAPLEHCFHFIFGNL